MFLWGILHYTGATNDVGMIQKYTALMSGSGNHFNSYAAHLAFVNFNEDDLVTKQQSLAVRAMDENNFAADRNVKSGAFVLSYRGGGEIATKNRLKAFNDHMLGLWKRSEVKLILAAACLIIFSYILSPQIVGFFGSIFEGRTKLSADRVSITENISHDLKDDDSFNMPLMNVMKAAPKTDSTGNMDSYTTAGLSFFLVAAARLGLR